jgi:hypothetical protein
VPLRCKVRVLQVRTAQVAVMKASEERIKAVDEEKLKLIEVSLAPLLL